MRMKKKATNWKKVCSKLEQTGKNVIMRMKRKATNCKKRKNKPI